LFAVLGVQCGPGVVEEHASAVWRLIGPDSFVIFPEVERALGQLRQQGYRLAIVSNWQRELGSFCRALGLDTHVDVIIASAEVGFAKPDSRIFDLACSRLGRPPDKVLHVGDSPVDDLQGATRAGLRAVLLQREGPPVGSTRTIRDLGDIGTMLLSESSP
jgi:putative hydrolase of the HAD superfamily